MEDEEGWQDGEMMGFAANTVSGAPNVIDINEELEAQLDVDEMVGVYQRLDRTHRRTWKSAQKVRMTRVPGNSPGIWTGQR